MERRPEELFYIKLESRRVLNANVSFLVFSSDKYHPIFFIKIPRNPNYVIGIAKEFENLMKIHSMLSSEKVKKAIPKPIFCSDVAGCLVFIESAIHGKRIRNIIKKGNLIKISEMIIDWLISFHKETTLNYERIDNFFINSFVKYPIEIFLMNFRRDIDGDIQHYFGCVVDKFSALKGVKIPISAQHGDFNSHNAYIKEKKNFGLIDWEDTIIESLPNLDLNHFFVTTAHILGVKEQRGKSTFSEYILERNWYNDIMRSFIKKYCTELKIEEAIYNLLFPLYLVHMANKDMEKQRILRESALDWVKRVGEYIEKNHFILK